MPAGYRPRKSKRQRKTTPSCPELMVWLLDLSKEGFPAGKKSELNVWGSRTWARAGAGRAGRRAGAEEGEPKARGSTQRGLWADGYHLFRSPETTDSAGCGASETEPPPRHHWAAETRRHDVSGLLPGSLCPPFPECRGPRSGGTGLCRELGRPLVASARKARGSPSPPPRPLACQAVWTLRVTLPKLFCSLSAFLWG